MKNSIKDSFFNAAKGGRRVYRGMILSSSFSIKTGGGGGKGLRGGGQGSCARPSRRGNGVKKLA